MMHTTGLYHFYSAADYDVIGITYEREFTMYFVLPKKRFGLSEVLSSLNAEALLSIFKNKSQYYCDVSQHVYKKSFKQRYVLDSPTRI